jgi:hypothetical protein
MKHVLALSGGKDSTAMALRLQEVEPKEMLYVCTPTGDEGAETFEHWRMLSKLLVSPLIPVSKQTLGGLIKKQNALPNWRQRWCTRILKIEPFAEFILNLNDEVTTYVGIRADEPERESGDYSDIPGVIMRFPLREWGWGLSDVVSYNESKGIKIPKRTDCEKCFFQRLIEWYDLWLNNPISWKEGEEWEAMTGHTFRSPGRDTWPASMIGLRKEFESGRIPKDTRRDPLKEMQCRVCRL